MKKIVFIFAIASFLLPIKFSQAGILAKELSGRILLQIEARGEAWYVNPKDNKRYFLGRPEDAWMIMREAGTGITDFDLAKIPISLIHQNSQDADADGLSRDFEYALGTDPEKKDTDNDNYSDYGELEKNYNPKGSGGLVYDFNFAARHQGKIFLQVERHGEAWYVNPVDKKRYFLGRPGDAFALMRSLGLGISNADLEKIPSNSAAFTGTQLEGKIFASINQERTANGLKPLKWNEELAAVARKHSNNLAKENEAFTGIGMSCSYPIIHHEGLDFGIYNAERLQSQGVYYYGSAGENIALVPIVSYQVLFENGDPRQVNFYACPDKRSALDASFKSDLDHEEDEQKKVERVKSEISTRTAEFAKEIPLYIAEQEWFSEEAVTADLVKGWMESPGHRANILTADFDETGIGNALVNGYIISTQVFIKRATCGFQDGVCCVEPEYYYCFSPLKCRNNLCLAE